MSADPGSGPRLLPRIFLVSAFGLALEVALIRWISTEIRIFAYFKNLTLIACFFGLGMGCLLGASPGAGAPARLARRLRFWWTFPILLGLCAAVALPKRLGHDPYGMLTAALGQFNEMPLWVWGSQVPPATAWLALGLLVALFLWITLLFVPAGALLGTWMEQAPDKFRAYSVNVLGSLAGIGWFTLVSFLALPPEVWFVTTLLPACALVAGRRERIVALAGTVAIGGLFLATRPAGETVHWSPYH